MAIEESWIGKSRLKSDVPTSILNCWLYKDKTWYVKFIEWSQDKHWCKLTFTDNTEHYFEKEYSGWLPSDNRPEWEKTPDQQTVDNIESALEDELLIDMSDVLGGES